MCPTRWVLRSGQGTIEGVVEGRGWVRVKVATEGTLGGRASSLRECGVEEVACFGLRARPSR